MEKGKRAQMCSAMGGETESLALLASPPTITSPAGAAHN